jgi:hypothetical protein
MIGAKTSAEALREANRSLCGTFADASKLEVYQDGAYRPAKWP